MKFKNSYILLIAIAIFLLVSIGSVCASEDAADNNSIASADAEVDLADGDILSDATQEKITTNITANSEKEKFSYDEEKNITVTVNDNESHAISNIDKNNLTVVEGSQNINFTYNNSIITILDKLSVGNHSLTINYLGNDNYTSSSTALLLKVSGNYTIETDETVYSDGKNVIIPIKIFDGVDYIPFDAEKLKVNYINETGNLTILSFSPYGNDKIICNIEDIIKSIPSGLTLNYTDAIRSKTVKILLNTTLNATVKKEYSSEENKTIEVKVLDLQGNVLNITKTDLAVLKNGANMNFTYSNSVITLTNIGEGTHNLTVVYKGNKTYALSNNTVVLNVYGKNQINVPAFVVVSDGKTVEIPISIFNGYKNITITKDNLTLNFTYTKEDGNVTTESITNFEFNEEKIIRFETNNLKNASLLIDYISSTGAKTVKINMETHVNLEPEKTKYRPNETNNITVRVEVNNGLLNFTKNDLKVSDNGNEIAFTLVNTTMTVNLNEGVHNLTVTYIGDDTYNSSSKTIELKVYGDLRINPSESIILDENNNASIFVNLNDGTECVEINETKLHIILYYTNGNKTIDAYTLNNQTVTFKVDENFDEAYAEIKYDGVKNTGKTEILVNTTVDASDLEYGESEVKNITIEVKATNGHVINLTDKNIQVLNNGKPHNISVNNSIITIKDALKFGVYNLTIKYLGTDTYLESNKTVTLTVYGINVTSSININSTKEGQVKIDIINGNETVNINKDDINITVSYLDGNKTVTIDVLSYRVEDKTLYFTLKDGNFTKATLNIRYNKTEANVTLNRIYNINVIPINTVADYQGDNFTFMIVDIDDNNAPIANKTLDITAKNSAGTDIVFTTINPGGGYSMGQTLKLTTNASGIAVVENKNFYPGYVFSTISLYPPADTYTFTVKGSGDLKGSNTTKITINKINVTITLEKFEEYYGTTKKVTIVVVNAKNGKALSGVNIVLSISGLTLSNAVQQTNENGTIYLGVETVPTGTYTVGYKTNMSSLNNYTGSGTFTIKQIPVTITAKNVKVYYNTGNTYTVKVTKDGKAVKGMYVYFRLYITSKKYQDFVSQTDNKGKVTFKASLAVGSHKIIVVSGDSRYSSKQITKKITVKKAKGKFTAKKVTAYYKGGKYFNIKLTNAKKKKPIYNAKVNIKVFVSSNRYNNYYSYTGMNGKIKLSLDSLKPGKYKIIVAPGESKNYTAKQITSQIIIKKTPTKLIPKKLTAKKGDKKYFKVTVKNKKTKKVIKGVKVKVKVYTGKKAKSYTVKTNKKGIAKLDTSKLKVGKHKVVVTSANKYCIAKKAKSSIKIKK